VLATLASYGVLEQFNPVHVFDTAIAAYGADTATVTS
jgi:hypothetical protein